MEDMDKIAELFEELKRASREPEEVLKVREKYLGDNLSSHRFSLMGAHIDSYRLIRNLEKRDEGTLLLDKLAEALALMLQESGYRNNIHTHQEHLLFGSSGSGLTKNAHENPYIVGGVLMGDITVEEARRARGLEYMAGNALGRHWGYDDELHCLLLSEIDDNGITLRDPVLADFDGVVLAERLVEGAPYRRE